MKVSRFEFDREHAEEAPPGRDAEGTPREAIRAAPDDKEDDRRIEEPIEEPGYGHGV